MPFIVTKFVLVLLYPLKKALILEFNNKNSVDICAERVYHLQKST